MGTLEHRVAFYELKIFIIYKTNMLCILDGKQNLIYNYYLTAFFNALVRRGALLGGRLKPTSGGGVGDLSLSLTESFCSSSLKLIRQFIELPIQDEFHEICHSVTFHFMKKHSKPCCDTTTPESIHTKDESKRGSAFAFIFGVN